MSKSLFSDSNEQGYHCSSDTKDYSVDLFASLLDEHNYASSGSETTSEPPAGRFPSRDCLSGELSLAQRAARDSDTAGSGKVERKVRMPLIHKSIALLGRKHGFNFFRLSQKLSSHEKALHFCQDRGLIHTLTKLPTAYYILPETREVLPHFHQTCGSVWCAGVDTLGYLTTSASPWRETYKRQSPRIFLTATEKQCNS